MENSPWIQIVLPIALIVLNLLAIAAMTVVGFLVKGKSDETKEKFKEMREDHKKLSNDLTDFKAQVPHHYVLRDDFVRAMIGFDSKLDKQSKDIREIARGMKGIKS